MKFADGIALFSKRNQRHVNQFSDFRARPRGSDCRERGPTRRFHPCNRSGRYPSWDSELRGLRRTTAISGRGEGTAKGARPRISRIKCPRASCEREAGRLVDDLHRDENNSTKERPVAATLALLQIRLALWLGNNKPRRREYCRCKKCQT
jgi:hypothetical protein